MKIGLVLLNRLQAYVAWLVLSSFRVDASGDLGGAYFLDMADLSAAGLVQFNRLRWNKRTYWTEPPDMYGLRTTDAE